MTRGFRAVRAKLLAPLAVVIAALAGSCTVVGTSPTIITALGFDTLPYPSVITGDTLRDSLGKAAPLHAVAFNAAGGVIAGSSVQYLALDSGVTIDASGLVTAQLRSGLVRVIASVPGLQSIVQRIIVTRRPDSVVVTSPRIDTLLYALPDNAGTNVSPALSLQVATLDTAGGITGTQGWLVSYQLMFHGHALAKSDTSVASLWSASGTTAQLLDTTAIGGVTAVRVRVRPAGLPSAAESLTVIATIRYRGASVRGSPVTYVIQTRPK